MVGIGGNSPSLEPSTDQAWVGTIYPTAQERLNSFDQSRRRGLRGSLLMAATALDRPVDCIFRRNDAGFKQTRGTPYLTSEAPLIDLAAEGLFLGLYFEKT